MDAPTAASRLPLVGALALSVLAGCTGSPPPELDEARRELQRARPQLALDALATAADHAEVHYLRGIALHQLGRDDAAAAELAEAIEDDSHDPRYTAATLRMRLFDRDLSAAEKLIELEQDHASSAAVRLASVYAYEALSVRLASQGQRQAAEAHRKRSRVALETAISLAAAIPEFQPELLEFARRYRLHDEALVLVRRMNETDPENADLTVKLITAMVAVGRVEDAVREADMLHRRHPRDTAVAVAYAFAMSATDAGREHDDVFRGLRRTFPGNVDILLHHASYLAQSDRMTSACEVLDSAIRSFRRKSERWPLVRVAITLPLNAGIPRLAESQLNRYRADFPEESLVGYFEGRVLFLNGDHEAALKSLRTFIRIRSATTGPADGLLTEALEWAGRIQAQLAEQAPNKAN